MGDSELATAPVICGSMNLWKPSTTSTFPNYFVMKILQEAGLSDGVINFLPGRGADVGDPVLNSKLSAGLHFTGSTPTLQHSWKEIGNNIETYNPYPHIVGDSKDLYTFFIFLGEPNIAGT